MSRLKAFRSAVCVALCLLGVGNASATLIDNSDGTVTQIRGDGSRLVWLKDANYAQTSGFDADGQMNWFQSMDWAATLNFAGFSDWRLPSALNIDGTGPCDSLNCTNSEMGNLYYVEFGGQPFAPPLDWTPFINVQYLIYSDYWTSTDGTSPSVPNAARVFNFTFGDSGETGIGKLQNNFPAYAWAVRDVPAIPEPETYAMMLAGLGMLGFAARRRKQRTA